MTARVFSTDRIIIGERHRWDLGNIDSLARSIAELGLLHPIVIKPDGTLIAGERRLAACRQLGWDYISVTVVDLGQIVRGEFAENAERKDFTLSESVAIKRALEPIERAAAKERRAAGGRLKAYANLAEASKGTVRDKVAAFAGTKRTTLKKAEAIVDAAEAEPEKYGKLKDDMDCTGRVNGVFKRLKVARQAEAICAEPPPVPRNGPYRVIVVDPPWPYEIRREDPSHRATHPFPQMSIAQICGLDVASIAHRDCLLWLWTTNHHMRQARRLTRQPPNNPTKKADSSLPALNTGRTPAKLDEHASLAEELSALHEALRDVRGYEHYAHYGNEHEPKRKAVAVLAAKLPSIGKLQAAWAMVDQPANAEENSLAAATLATEMRLDPGINRRGFSKSLAQHLTRMNLTAFELQEVVFDLQRRLRFALTIADVWEAADRLKEKTAQLREVLADRAKLEGYAQCGEGWEEEKERNKQKRREKVARLTEREREYVISHLGPNWEDPESDHHSRYSPWGLDHFIWRISRGDDE